MRAKYSPTIAARYVDQIWWIKNGGGYGIMPDGTDMSEIYFNYDHEGYDLFGYDEHGHDRAGYTIRHYEGSEELYREIADAWSKMPQTQKPVSEYWALATDIVRIVSEKFPGLPVVQPRQDTPLGNHIAISRIKSGGYSIKLNLDIVDGAERSLEFRLDDGTGGSSASDSTWTATSVAHCGGEARTQALCFVEDREFILDFVFKNVGSFEPDRRLYDIALKEDHRGMVLIAAFPRAEHTEHDLLGSVYASTKEQAISTFANRHAKGGVIEKMAFRGMAALQEEVSEKASTMQIEDNEHEDLKLKSGRHYIK